MPTINKLVKKPYKRTSNKLDRHKYVYSTKRWQDLRIEKMKNNPLCEMCKDKNLIKLAEEVHHIIHLSSVYNREDLQNIGFDYNNLMSLCTQCHDDVHKN